jgi:hypothetical protein
VFVSCAYYIQYLQICQATCFCCCISKAKNEFGQNPEENIILTGPGQYYTFMGFHDRVFILWQENVTGPRNASLVVDVVFKWLRQRSNGLRICLPAVFEIYKWCVPRACDVFLSKNEDSVVKTREASEGVEYDFYLTEYELGPVWLRILLTQIKFTTKIQLY